MVLFQDKFYDIYVSAFYAAKEFSQNPSGMKIILSFDEGLNLMPDIDMALQNPDFYFPSLLMQMFMPLKITPLALSLLIIIPSPEKDLFIFISGN